MNDRTRFRNRKKKDFIEAMQRTMGNVSKSCTAAGIARETFYRWLDEDPDFAKAVEEVNETNIDMVESALFQQINDGNVTATIFYLKTKGKKRGYVEQTDVNVSGGVKLRPLTDEEIEELRALNGR